jgi:hypothetical protein
LPAAPSASLTSRSSSTREYPAAQKKRNGFFDHIREQEHRVRFGGGHREGRCMAPNRDCEGYEEVHVARLIRRESGGVV